GGSLVADLRSDNRDVFLTVGAVSDLIESLSERLNTYAAQLPKQARWQAELLVAGTAGTYSVEGALGDVHDVGTAARRATAVLDDVPALLGAQRDIVASERGLILADVDRQRQQTLAYVTGERLAVLAAIREERLTLVAALRQ